MTTIMEKLAEIEEAARRHEELVQGQTDEQGNEDARIVPNGRDDFDVEYA